MNRRLRQILLFCLASVFSAATTFAQNLNLIQDNIFNPPSGNGASTPPTIPAPLTPGDAEANHTPDANTTPADDNRPALPYNQVQRDSGPPYTTMFYSVGADTRIEPKAGGVHLDIPHDLLSVGVNYNLPFVKPGAEDTNATVRIGRFYYDVKSLSAAALYSDNINETQTNRQGGVIAIIELDGMAFWQLTENLRLAVDIGLVYLPIRSKFGIAGITDNSGSDRIFLADQNQPRAQLSYNIELGHWEIIVYDQARTAIALSLADRFDVNAVESFDEQDRAGRYVFRGNTANGSSGSQLNVNESGSGNRQAFRYANNQIGATVSRLLPTETRLTFGAYRLNYWYFGGNSASAPNSRDVAFIEAHSERENLRFKPFASYEIYRNNEQLWDQEIRTGVQVPVSENINLSAGVGYFIGGQTHERRFLANASIQHDIDPLTRQTLLYSRDITAPEQSLDETYSYTLRQIIGPYLTAQAFAAYSTFDDLSHDNTATREWRTGLLLTSDTSSKTSFTVGGVYYHVQYLENGLGTYSRWTALAQVTHRFTDTFKGTLTYQYQNRASDQVNDSYYEDVVELILTKTFH